VTDRPAEQPDEQPDERSLVSARLLIDLVSNTLDPGYAAAAKQPRRPRWYDQPAVALGCLLIGFVLVVAYVHTHRGEPAAKRVHDDLVARVRAAQHVTDGLAGQVNAAEARLAREQDRALPASGLAQQLSRSQLAAGELPVHGPGLTVTLREPPASNPSTAPGRGGGDATGTTNILGDRDVRSVVNELWHDGAEAIGVNGIRLTPTSSIRVAGDTILVDFQPIGTPYAIAAIGSADGLATNFAQSAVASRYQTLKGADHIGFGFTESDSLSLPASAPVTPRYAQAGRK
jgi:uncharacterized protein YlxW (UPF0749 family)